jgi:hypothetical protein
MRLTLMTVLSLSAASACRTDGIDSTAQEGPIRTASLPDRQGATLAEISGPGAEVMYNGFNIEEQIDSLGGRKTYSGDAYIFCTRTNGAAHIPSGGKGAKGGKGANVPQLHNCRMGVPFDPPAAGEQDRSPQPFLVLDGDAAGAFYDSFAAPAVNASADTQQKSWEGSGSFLCTYAKADGADTNYFCQAREGT